MRLIRGEGCARGRAGGAHAARRNKSQSYAVYDIHAEKILANRAASWRARNRIFRDAPLRKNSGNAETQRSLKEPSCSDLVLSVIPLVAEAKMDNTTPSFWSSFSAAAAGMAEDDGSRLI
jgi:hypothetical protein